MENSQAIVVSKINFQALFLPKENNQASTVSRVNFKDFKEPSKFQSLVVSRDFEFWCFQNILLNIITPKRNFK